MNLTQDELQLIREALDLKMNAWFVSHRGENADLNADYLAMNDLYHKTFVMSAILKAELPLPQPSPEVIE